VLATQFGSHAVRLIIEGRFGEMVCYNPPAISSVPIIEAVNKLSRVDPNGSAVQSAQALGISFGDDPSNQPPFLRPSVVAAAAGCNSDGITVGSLSV
jgi:6-phosphofructokinase 1